MSNSSNSSIKKGIDRVQKEDGTWEIPASQVLN